jgi:hypothetical protein
LGCGETESTWYVDHHFADLALDDDDDDDCGAIVEMIGKDTEVLGGNLHQCHFVQYKFHMA